MADRCEPKQNNCTKAGTGPSCQEAKYGGPAKARCLEIVKENCEEQRDQCIQQCIDSKVAAFEAARKAESEALQKQIESLARAASECYKSQAYLNIYGTDYNINRALGPGSNGLRLLYRKIATQGDIYRVLTGRNPIDGSAVSQRSIDALQKNRPAAHWDNVNAAGALERWKELNAEAKEKEDQLRNLCPGPVLPTDDRDICKMEQEENGDISDCISQCWFNSLSDCDTRHCMCGSYKCEGPDIDNGGFKPPPEPEPPPNIVVTEGTARDDSIEVTLSQYGVPIQLLYGREFLFGNVIWMGDVNEVRSYTTTVSYDPQEQSNVTKQTLNIDNYLSFHAGLCAGPVDAISRVWLEGGLIYDKYASSPITVESQDRLRVRVFTGEETSKVDAVQAAAIGFGRVPAYRGLAGASIENINISDLRQFPNLRFEVIKQIAEDVPAIVSDDYTVTGEVFYDFPHRRVFAQTDVGVRVLNYDTLASVALLDLQDFVAPTAFPNILTYDADELHLFDPNHGDLIRTLDVPDSGQFTFTFRYVDESNAGFQLAGLMVGDDLTLYKINDMTGDLTLWATLNNILGGAATTATPIMLDRTTITSTTIDAGAYSLFLTRAATDRLQIADLMCFNTDQHTVGVNLAYPQIDAGTFGEYELEFDTADLTLLGTMACTRDKTLVFFVEHDGTYEIVKWHPDNGVSWRTEVSSLPDFGKYSPARANIGRVYTFVDTSGTAVNVDLDTGEAIEGAVGNPIPASPQTYDDQLGAVTYYSADGSFTRVFADRISEEATSVADIIRDICDRAGLSTNDIYTADLEGVEIVGFRSGGFLRGSDILNNLFTIYPSTSFADNQIVFIRKATAATSSPSVDDLAADVVVARRDEAHDLKSVTITYDSTATDNLAQQTFSLPDDPYDGRQTLSYDLPALLDDDYARSLAELITFAGQENDVKSSFELPPRYLSITPSDIANVSGSWRIAKVETGWDLSSRFEGYSDGVSKYTDLATITGVAGFDRFERDTTQKPCASLIALPMRTIFPTTVYSGTTFLGLADVFGTFETGAVISRTDNEFSNDPGQQLLEMPEAVVYGRLITPPPVCSNALTTQLGASMVIKMASAEMVDRLSFSEITDLYSNPYTCLILVGQEFIQYSDFEVDIDGVTVTFYNLMRARHFTEGSMDHSAGELAVVFSIGGLEEISEFGDAYNQHKKFICTAAPDAATRLDVNFLRDAPNVFTDPGAFHPLRRDYAGDGIMIHVDRTDLKAYPFPEFTWTPALDEQSVEIWLLRQPYDEATFAMWRATFDFTDFSYVLTWGNNAELFFTTDPEPFFKLFGLLFTDSEITDTSFDVATEPLYAVTIRGGLAADIPETITVTKFEPRMDYTRFVGGTNVS
jgi:hypothetical protein